MTSEDLGDTAAPDSDEVSAPLTSWERTALDFPVVGIGASAGGLDALRKFFNAMPANTGMAFVVVQHLPPDRESLMAEILSRHTSMSVHQIEDGMAIKPNQVFVIRPGHTVTVEDGALRLGEPVEKRGHRRPVDDFFRSLAVEQKGKAIAVILSGMGTNGTAGAQAIKAAGGLCIAQDPETAEFPSMPQSLIHAGYADGVLDPAVIPAVLNQYIQRPFMAPDPQDRARTEHAMLRDRQHLNEIFAILRTRSGHDFTGYKKPTVLRRVQRRMGLSSATTLAEYAAQLRDQNDEVLALANDLMINVTGFFRDEEAWEALRTAAIRPLVERRATNGTIRAWVTACASGEEPYSLAMLLAEEIDRAGKTFEVKIFATDTADKSLALARAGVYPGGIEGDISPDRLDRFFDRSEHSYRVKKEIREMVVFAGQDLLRDPPFSKVDVCTCRNLLIYLEPEIQQRVMTLLHFALRDGGYLFLGNAETLGRSDKTFEVVSKKWRIYRRTGPTQPRPIDMAGSPLRLADVRRADAIALSLARPSQTPAVQQALLDRFAPPCVVVDQHDRVLYYQGDLSPFVTQPAGEPTHNLFEVLRSSLRPVVRAALRQASAANSSMSIDSEIDTMRDVQRLSITAAPLTPLSANHLCISFEAKADKGSAKTGAATDVEYLPTQPRRALQAVDEDNELEKELRIMRRELQSTVEAFEASNEELKASNEEVISINEELQSSNEELETSKEELQSLNEELITVNGQLHAKIAELDAINNDLSNLLGSTNIAVLFLDTNFGVRRFTPAINDLLELIPADVGRPVTHLAQKFEGDLVEDARAVLSSLVPIEAEIRSRSGKWYVRRTLPYRTTDNHIDGVVITFVDITRRKRAEMDVLEARVRLQATLEEMPAAVLLAEMPSGKVVFGNRRLSKLFGLPFPLPFVGATWAAASTSLTGVHPDGRGYRAEEWPLARTLKSGASIDEEEIDYRRANGDSGTLLASSTAVGGEGSDFHSAIATFTDVTARKRSTEALRESEQRSRLLIESASDYAIFSTDMRGIVTSWNKGAERLLGWSEGEILGKPAAVMFTPEDRMMGKVEEEMEIAARDGRAADERMHLRKDSSRFWASGILTPLTDSKGTACGFAKIMRDNTERKQAEQAVQQALRQSESSRAGAEQANRAKDDFISTVSHELRTPLNTIRLWSRMLGSGRLPHESWSEGIKTIDRAALAQQTLIDDLLDVSRMSSGKLRLALRPTRLAEAIKGAIEAVQPMADARKIALEVTLSRDVGVVRADPERIQQVVWNLLSNAVKFTPGGGRVRVSLSRDKDIVCVSVEDSGAGIRKEFLPHVFERFRQGEAGSNREHGGLGLGLAIAKQLVELHGGTIDVESAGEGKGATFTFRLPLPSMAKLDTDETVDNVSGPESELNGVRALLVEDDSATREATCRLLEMHGAEVHAVSAAVAALDAYSTQIPDVLVSDIGLPGEDGFALMEQIRAIEVDRGLPAVPALALTAFARGDDRRRALEAGFSGHMAKPVDTKELIATIQRLTAKRE